MNQDMQSGDKNIVWQQGLIGPGERQSLLGQKGLVAWITGLSGSGKSTIAYECEKRLLLQRRMAFVLDGDNVRHGLNRDLGFSAGDRTENIRRVTEVAKLFADAGVIALTSFISPYRRDRDAARLAIGPERFIEVYIQADLSVCEERDPKGLYKKARAGEVRDFTGISAPYEEPENPDIIIDSQRYGLEECVSQLMNYIIKKSAL